MRIDNAKYGFLGEKVMNKMNLILVIVIITGSTALQMAYVAKGSLVGTIANTPKLWDIAAGIILIERAGGIVTDVQGKPLLPVDLEKYNGQQLQILATNKKVHNQMLEIFSQK